ncbi:MAG: lysylphosphatidylglycerol synthase domain-containing protein, partial [Acidobacteria bacterium]|nr:lysylphosphatidylglycerol synthase domain-containing protein [Acidobacteriota bacterium]
MISVDEELNGRPAEGDAGVVVPDDAEAAAPSAEEESRGGGAGRKVFWGQAIAFLLGVALLVYVLRRVGIQPVFDALAQIGFGLFLLFFISGLRHFIRAAAMRTAVAPEHRRFNLWQAFSARLGGEAISFLTFTGPILGEATKAALLKKRVPLIAGAQALVVDNLLYNVSVALFILSGAVVMLLSYDLPPSAHYALLLIAASSSFVLLLVGYALSRRVKPVSWLLDKMKDRRLEPKFLRKRDEHIHRVESYVYQFYQHRRGAFFLIVLLDLVSHASSVWEVYVTLSMLGFRPRASAPYIIESLTKVINFVFGFVPATIGVYEGGTGVILHALGYAAATGVTLGLVRKAGMIFWTGIGLMVLSARTLPSATRRLVDRHPRLRKAMDNLVLSNISHRPARTLVTILGVGVGVLLVVFTVGLAHGVLRERGRREASVGAEIMLRASGTIGLTGQQPFRLPAAHAQEIARVAGVRAAVPVGQVTDKTDSGFGNRIIDGVNFDEYAKLAGLHVVAGRAIASGDEAMVDSTWIEQNKAKKNSGLGGTLTMFDRPFRIVGVYEPPGGGRVKIPLTTMQDQVGSPDRVSSILVACTNPAEADAVAGRIHDQFPEDQIIFTRDLPELYAAGVPALNVFISVVVAIAAAISVLVILLAMYTT